MIQSGLFHDPMESRQSRRDLVIREYQKQFTFYPQYKTRDGQQRREPIYIEPTRMVLLAVRMTWELLFRELRDGAKQKEPKEEIKSRLAMDEKQTLERLIKLRRRLHNLGVLELHPIEHQDVNQMQQNWRHIKDRNLAIELIDAACLVRHLFSESGRGATNDPLWFVNDPKQLFDDFYSPSKKIQLTNLQASMVQNAAMRSLSPEMMRQLLEYLRAMPQNTKEKQRFVYGLLTAEAQRRLKINGKSYKAKPKYIGSEPKEKSSPNDREWNYLAQLLQLVGEMTQAGKLWLVGARDYNMFNDNDPLKRAIRDDRGQIVLDFATIVDNGKRTAVRGKGSPPYRDKRGRFAREREPHSITRRIIQKTRSSY